ncbi:MAG TPA: hypothetical protein VKO43_00515 [Candidatus Krumholzibacteriaceae bacterium]|nr:hypothetical protein [Candidatus Krumholzibacteriaceae bacterium]
MPGISFIYKPVGGLKKRKAQSLKALDSVIHEKWIERNILLEDDRYFLCCTSHAKYPVTVIENGEYFICLEGKIYGKTHSEISSEIRKLVKLFIENSGSSREKITRWLMDTNGDFIIFILHRKSSSLWILNDALGRLPLYWNEDAGTLTVSRELRFIHHFSGGTGFDRTGSSQFLLLGFPLGRRTLLKNTFRLPPASVIRSDGKSDRVSIETLYNFNYDSKNNRGLSVGESADRMVAIFSDMCGKMADPVDKNIITQSGGLDSRAVASALTGIDIDFSGATFLDYYKTAAKDIDIARELSEVLNFDWKLFEIGQATGEEVLKLLRMKNGMNFLGMSFSIPYFNAIRTEWGDRITYFTGEGGGLIIPDSRPFKKLKDTHELTRFIIKTNHVVPLDITAAVTGIRENDIIAEIREELAAYPERGMDGKYVHFIINQRNLKWTSEGEDRNRFYFWTVSPFNSIHFFNFVMNCPDKHKAKYKLYREFLLKLSPEASAVRNANWGFDISSKKYLLYLYARELYYILPASLKKLLRNKVKQTNDVIGPYGKNSKIVECFNRQIQNCHSIGEYLSLGGISENTGKLGKFGFDHLFTLTSIIEDLSSSSSSIENYTDSGMI